MFITTRKRTPFTSALSTAPRKMPSLIFECAPAIFYPNPNYNFLYCLPPQLELPHRETDQRFLSLGLADDIQRSGVLSRPEADQRGERRHLERTAGQPVAGQRDQSDLHRLLHLQCQHQHVLHHQVKSPRPLLTKPPVTKGFIPPLDWWLNSQLLVERFLPIR